MENVNLLYDIDDEIKFISERTNINADTVAKVLEADVEFMRKLGVIKAKEE